MMGLIGSCSMGCLVSQGPCLFDFRLAARPRQGCWTGSRDVGAGFLSQGHGDVTGTALSRDIATAFLSRSRVTCPGSLSLGRRRGVCHGVLVTGTFAIGTLSRGPCRANLVTATSSQGPCHRAASRDLARDLAIETSPWELVTGGLSWDTGPRDRNLCTTGTLSQGLFTGTFVTVSQGHGTMTFVTGLVTSTCHTESLSRGPCQLVTGTVSRGCCHGTLSGAFAAGLCHGGLVVGIQGPCRKDLLSVILSHGVLVPRTLSHKNLVVGTSS
ncbi:hypothetical protein M885DRAFT_261847 [Pelagophyceae sp. CCMP2097]|nr:hypothetical protein M885DRAFT_261847 [Pelagophyceae sp. CCMP2097]